MLLRMSGPVARRARGMASVAIAFGALLSLMACGFPTVPRGREVGDVLGVGGLQLVGVQSLDRPLSSYWGFRIEPPRLWFIDPRDAVAASVRVGLKTLDVYPGCRPVIADVAPPETVFVDGVRWVIQVALEDGPSLRMVFEGNPGLLLVADSVVEPTRALRFRPVDAEMARRALSFGASVADFEDGRLLLDGAVRGAAVDLRAYVVVSVAEHAAFGDCATMIAELSSEGTTVWMAAGR